MTSLIATFCSPLSTPTFHKRRQTPWLDYRPHSERRKHGKFMMGGATPKPSRRLIEYLSRAEEGNPAISLDRAEAAFTAMKARTNSSASINSRQNSRLVTTSNRPLLQTDKPPDYDAVIAGGTLGSIYAAALQSLGWRVAVIERGTIQGRNQEWNISRSELSALLSTNVLSESQLEDAIVTECTNAGRLAFASRKGTMREVHVPDVLNVGVAPDILIEHVLNNFRQRGGKVLEMYSLTNVSVHTDCVQITLRKSDEQGVRGSLGAGGTGFTTGYQTNETMTLTSRLLIDAMGAFSPIAEQSRSSRRPDGICITVGSCMTANWPSELIAPDIMVSQSAINEQRSTQYFWEAFPTGRDASARTTYMFAYGSCDARRQTLTETLEDYIRDVEMYQGVSVDDITSVKRILFGFFPSYYRSCPTDVAFDRILPVGDAGGLQSPISFGGFGCTMRHLRRITTAVNEALQGEIVGGDKASNQSRYLSRRKLQMLQWYLPSLSVTGLFHKAMSVQPGQKSAGVLLDEYGINDVLWNNMKAMKSAGSDVQMTFLRDVVTAGGMSKTLAGMVVMNPGLAVRLSVFIGPTEILVWLRHYAALVGYASALPFMQAMRRRVIENNLVHGETRFWLNRLVDALTYGSGADALQKE